MLPLGGNDVVRLRRTMMFLSVSVFFVFIHSGKYAVNSCIDSAKLLADRVGDMNLVKIVFTLVVLFFCINHL